MKWVIQFLLAIELEINYLNNMKKEKWNPNDWQGRRKEQVEGHAMMALISIVGLMGILMVLSLIAN